MLSWLARSSGRVEQAPVDQVARVMDLHAGKPLERRRRDVVVVADADDRRIGIEAAEDRIANRALVIRYAAGGDGVGPPLAHERPQDDGAEQIEHREADEERRVADRA